MLAFFNAISISVLLISTISTFASPLPNPTINEVTRPVARQLQHSTVPKSPAQAAADIAALIAELSHHNGRRGEDLAKRQGDDYGINFVGGDNGLLAELEANSKNHNGRREYGIGADIGFSEGDNGLLAELLANSRNHKRSGLGERMEFSADDTEFLQELGAYSEHGRRESTD